MQGKEWSTLPLDPATELGGGGGPSPRAGAGAVGAL